jgi:hypothetical protein
VAGLEVEAAKTGGSEDVADARCQESLAIGEQYNEGIGPFPERLPELQLTSRFLTDFYLLVEEWAGWASSIVDTWPEDPRQAKHDPDVIAETVRRAANAVGRHTRVGVVRPEHRPARAPGEAPPADLHERSPSDNRPCRR